MNADEIERISNEALNDATVGVEPVDSPYVLVLTGLQYSGKSYLASQITTKGFVHFWATKIKKDYGTNNEEMLQIALRFTEIAITKGFNVIIDYVNQKKSMRQLFQAKALSFNARYSVIFLDTPAQERYKRREENVISGDQSGRRVISLEQMKQFEDAFEIPSDDENTIVLKTDEDSAHFIETL